VLGEMPVDVAHPLSTWCLSLLTVRFCACLGLMQGISKSAPSFIAWRWAFFVPASFHVLLGISVMLLAQVR